MLLLSLVDRKKGRGRGLFIFFLGLWWELKGWEVRELERENGGSGLFSLEIEKKRSGRSGRSGRSAWLHIDGTIPSSRDNNTEEII
jgi:hypothetical protein